MSLRAMALAAALLACAAPHQALAQESAEEALHIVRSYLAAHNTHDLARTLTHYAPDAVFVLNNARGPVSGGAAIADLERFDVAAGSTVHPYALTARREGEDWIVSFDGVIEHSAIFEAIGLTIVGAEGEDRGFVLRRGRIVQLVQPDLYPACGKAAVAAFDAIAAWLLERGDPRVEDLVSERRLKLTVPTIAPIIRAARAWRAQTGGIVSADQARDCALGPDSATPSA